jgi:uncharacterized membrane protein YoaK (UPF0700 family)
MKEHPDKATPRYRKYEGLELQETSAWVQMLSQLCRFRKAELALVLITVLALAILYKSGLSENVQITVFLTMFVLGVVNTSESKTDASPNPEAVKGPT